ncbi:MAG: hypothetical protein AB1824_01280 [Acidobacteriota bacterium]
MALYGDLSAATQRNVLLSTGIILVAFVTALVAIAVQAVFRPPGPATQLTVDFILPEDAQALADVPGAAPRVYCLERPEREWTTRLVRDEETGRWAYRWTSRSEAWPNRSARWVAYSQDGLGRVAVAAFVPANTARVHLEYARIESPDLTERGVWAPMPTGLPMDLAVSWGLLVNGRVAYTCPWGSDRPEGGATPDLGRLEEGDQLCIRVRLIGDAYLYSATAVIASYSAETF